MNDDNFYAYIAEEQDKKQDMISALKKILNYLEKTEQGTIADESDGGLAQSEEHISALAGKRLDKED